MTDKEFNILVDKIYKNYKGQGDKLTDAMGSMVSAHYFGWRVLLMLTSETRVRKHQKILGVDFKELFEERGKYAHRSLGLRIADKIGNFWDVIQNRVKVDRVDKICIE